MATIERREHFDAAPHEVWDAIVDAEALSAWFGAAVDLEVHRGGRVRTVDADGVERVGVVDDIVEGRRVTFTWMPVDDDDGPASTVELEVAPCDDGTLLHVRETTLGLDWLSVTSAPPGEFRALAYA